MVSDGCARRPSADLIVRDMRRENGERDDVCRAIKTSGACECARARRTFLTELARWRRDERASSFVSSLFGGSAAGADAAGARAGADVGSAGAGGEEADAPIRGGRDGAHVRVGFSARKRARGVCNAASDVEIDEIRVIRR